MWPFTRRDTFFDGDDTPFEVNTAPKDWTYEVKFFPENARYSRYGIEYSRGIMVAGLWDWASTLERAHKKAHKWIAKEKAKEAEKLNFERLGLGNPRE